MEVNQEDIADAMQEFLQLDGEEESEEISPKESENGVSEGGWGFGKHAERNAELSRATKTIEDYYRRWKRYTEFISQHFPQDVKESGMSLQEFCLTRRPESPSYAIAWICYECDLVTEVNPDTNESMGCLGKSVKN